jgi:hypothetical protein
MGRKRKGMASADMAEEEQQLQALTGALDALNELKAALELRLEEARDDCVREVLDNIIALVDAQGIEYRRRQHVLRAASVPQQGAGKT